MLLDALGLVLGLGVILPGALRWCFHIEVTGLARPLTTLAIDGVLPDWVSSLDRFHLRPLALGPTVGGLAPGFGGMWGMGTVFRLLILGVSTFGRPFSRIVLTLL